jgi:hypothetical protein
VLVTSAVPRLRCPEEANLRAPESVVTLHTSFIRAGADLIETNTSARTAQAVAALPRGRVRAINGAGVKLGARGARGGGPRHLRRRLDRPLGDLAVPPAKRTELFAEQADLLDGRGIDLFMVETFYDLDELEAAIEAVRGVSSLPIVATLTFDEGAETLAGVTAATPPHACAARAGRDRGEPRRGPARRARRARGNGLGRRAAAGGVAERRSRKPERRPRDLPARHAEYFAEFAAHAVSSARV